MEFRRTNFKDQISKIEFRKLNFEDRISKMEFRKWNFEIRISKRLNEFRDWLENMKYVL